MSHTLNYQFFHIVWPTKNLLPLITEDTKALLLGYITGILKNLGGNLLLSAGTENHVHLLAQIPTDLSIAELLCKIKSGSSKWYRIKNRRSDFGWNDGYSAFTVSPSSLNAAKQYLACDKDRHVRKSFEDELLSFLNLHEIEFKHQYLFNTTYTRLIYHLVWSVKNREPLLNSSLQRPLHKLIEQEIHKFRGKLYAVGNVADHIHVLLENRSNISIATLVQNLKTTTTHLIKSKESNGGFGWQEGFGVFSVGIPAFKHVFDYVNNQEKHHQDQDQSFDQEWIELKEDRIRFAI